MGNNNILILTFYDIAKLFSKKRKIRAQNAVVQIGLLIARLEWPVDGVKLWEILISQLQIRSAFSKLPSGSFCSAMYRWSLFTVAAMISCGFQYRFDGVAFSIVKLYEFSACTDSNSNNPSTLNAHFCIKYKQTKDCVR